MAELFHLSGETRHARLELIDTAHHGAEIGHRLRRLRGRFRRRRRGENRGAILWPFAEGLRLKIAEIALDAAKARVQLCGRLSVGDCVERDAANQTGYSDESTRPPYV